MYKVKTGKIKLKDIKYIENSRLRENKDVSDLMKDIEQRGLMQPVGIRTSDNALIYGNRRVRAYENLGYSEIDAEFYEDVTDEDLLMMNVAENIKRKQIGGIELGRVCNMLLDRGMTKLEIAEKLGIKTNQVKYSLASYNVVLGTPFEKLIISGEKKLGTVQESIIWLVQNSISSKRKLTKSDWNIILRYIEQGKITKRHVTLLRNLLISDKSMTLNRALDIMDSARLVFLYIPMNDKELSKEMIKGKHLNPADFIKSLIKAHNENLLF